MPNKLTNATEAAEYLRRHSIEDFMNLVYAKNQDENMYATNAYEFLSERYGPEVAEKCRSYIVNNYGADSGKFYSLLRETIDKHTEIDGYSNLRNIYNDIFPAPDSLEKHYNNYGEVLRTYCEEFYIAYNSFTGRMEGFTWDSNNAAAIKIPSEDLIIWIGLVYSFTFDELNALLYNANYNKISSNGIGNSRYVFIRDAFKGIVEDKLQPLKNKKGFERALAFNYILNANDIKMINPKEN